MLKFFKQQSSDAVRLWNQFWFAPAQYFNVSVLRFVIGICLFINYLGRIFDYEYLYSDKGILPFSTLLGVVPESHNSIIPWEYLVKNAQIGFALHIVFLILLLAFAFGVLNRFFTIFLFIIHIAFLRRNPVAAYGADMVSTFWLMYFCLIRSNLQFSILNILIKERWTKIQKKLQEQDLLSSVGYRLIQLQLCIVYAYSGMEKAKGMSWWQGDAVLYALGNTQVVSMDLTFLAHFPLLITAMSFATILWETYFPFVVWILPLRPYALMFGAFMHTGIIFVLNLPVFAILMMSIYILFIPQAGLKKFLKYKH